MKNPEFVSKEELQKLLDEHGNCSRIDLSFKPIDFEGAKVLAKHMNSGVTWCGLWLSGCEIDDKSLEVILDALRKNNTIISVLLNFNEITDVGAKLIADYIKDFSLLCSFSLENNKISNDGYFQLLVSLKTNFYANTSPTYYDEYGFRYSSSSSERELMQGLRNIINNRNNKIYNAFGKKFVGKPEFLVKSIESLYFLQHSDVSKINNGQKVIERFNDVIDYLSPYRERDYLAKNFLRLLGICKKPTKKEATDETGIYDLPFEILVCIGSNFSIEEYPFRLSEEVNKKLLGESIDS